MTAPAAAPPIREEMLPLPYRVVGSRRETHDTVTVRFAPQHGAVDHPAPGQFTMLYVFGIGEVPISIAGYTAGTAVITHSVRAVGAVTDAICALDRGAQVGLRGPYGVGWPVAVEEGRDLVVIAGGIGLAPLRPVIHHVVENRQTYGAVSLIYGARTPDDVLYTDELRDWRGRFDLDVEVTVDRASNGWHGDVGLVTNLLGRIAFRPDQTVAMTCGPEIMMKVVARDLIGRGVDPDGIALSLERNMKCAIGFCGHCQYGPDFVCRDGPVVSYAAVRDRLRVDEL